MGATQGSTGAVSRINPSADYGPLHTAHRGKIESGRRALAVSCA